MASLDLLRDRLDLLLRQHAALKTENTKLRRSVDAKEEETAMLRKQLTGTEEQLLALQIGKTMPDAEARASSRRKLDAVIGEIDKILTTLND
jgi:cell division protein FtsB